MKERSLVIPKEFDSSKQNIVGIFAAQLDKQHELLKKAVEGFTVEQLEWQLNAGMNTVGVLLAHIAIAETYWINAAVDEIQWEKGGNEKIKEIIGIYGDDDDIDKEKNDKHPDTLKGKTLSDYLEILDKCRQATKQKILTWDDQILEKKYNLSDKHCFSYSWTLYHILEHLASHLGQILLLKHIMQDQGILETSK